MEKEFVPYDQSVALKELGFDEPCVYYVDKNNESYIYNFETHPDEFIEWCGVNVIPTPTFSQAFRWFREKYNLIFQINYLFNGNYQVVIHRNTHEYMELIQNLKHSCVYEIPDNYSYEEGELACLLELINICKKK